MLRVVKNRYYLGKEKKQDKFFLNTIIIYPFQRTLNLYAVILKKVNDHFTLVFAKLLNLIETWVEQENATS